MLLLIPALGTLWQEDCQIPGQPGLGSKNDLISKEKLGGQLHLRAGCIKGLGDSVEVVPIDAGPGTQHQGVGSLQRTV